MRSAIYIVETDSSKEPREDFLGSRLIASASKTVQKQSVLEKNGEHDGHVNRNIRIALALLDMVLPQIEVVEVKAINETSQRVTWRVNGCHSINQAHVLIHNATDNSTYEEDLLNRQGTFCNYPPQENQ